MGIFEKRRYRQFLLFVQEFNPEDQSTWKGYNPKETTSEEIMATKFKLEQNTIDFTGHALALYSNDE